MQVSITMVRALVGVVERSGASRERFLELARVEPRWLEEGALRLPIVDYLRAIEAAVSVSGDPALGLHMGEHLRSTSFDVLGPLTEQARTLRHGVDAIARYSRLLAEGQEPQLREADDTATLRFPALRGSTVAVRLTAEFTMTGLASMLQQFAGPKATPSKVCFAYEQPPYAAEYQRVFGGVACFAQEHTELIFRRAWLDQEQLYRDPELHTALQEQAERRLGRLERGASMRERIEGVLARAGQRPLTMQDVARELDMSARTVRRHLQAEGVDFTGLVASARMNAAKRLLERPGASMKETAYAMGFASVAAFHRAFKRWTGKTPKEYQNEF